jgi:hypothetical protein
MRLIYIILLVLLASSASAFENQNVTWDSDGDSVTIQTFYRSKVSGTQTPWVDLLRRGMVCSVAGVADGTASAKIVSERDFADPATAPLDSTVDSTGVLIEEFAAERYLSVYWTGAPSATNPYVLITCSEPSGPLFYGLDASIGANAGIMRYELNLNIPGVFVGLDRSDPAPANWETDTGDDSGSPFRVKLTGNTPSGLMSILGTAYIDLDEAGNYGIEFANDTVDDVVVNVKEIGPHRWLSETPGPRQYAIEWNVAMESFGDIDFFIGVCDNPEVLNSDGTLNAVRRIGFHFLRSDGLDAPILEKTSGGVVTLDIPTLSEANNPGMGQPSPAPNGPSGYARYAIKGITQRNWEWYINDQLVGYSPQTAEAVFLELSICMGYVTNGNILSPANAHVDRIIAVMKDNNTD